MPLCKQVRSRRCVEWVRNGCHWIPVIPDRLIPHIRVAKLHWSACGNFIYHNLLQNYLQRVGSSRWLCGWKQCILYSLNIGLLKNISASQFWHASATNSDSRRSYWWRYNSGIWPLACRICGSIGSVERVIVFYFLLSFKTVEKEKKMWNSMLIAAVLNSNHSTATWSYLQSFEKG